MMSVKRTPISSGRPRKPAPSRGRADLARIRRLSDEEIARTSPDELRDLPTNFWDKASPVFPNVKVPISLRVDADVLAWFRKTGARYQSRMNAVLRSYMEHVSRSRGRRGV